MNKTFDVMGYASLLLVVLGMSAFSFLTFVVNMKSKNCATR
jgi:hypothetical protein